MSPWQRSEPPTHVPLDPVTVRELARLLGKRLADAKTYGGSCRTCHEAEAHAFLAKLRELVQAGQEGR
jgi:hypothetical protein